MVEYNVTKEMVLSKSIKKRLKFYYTSYSAKSKDYIHSGYDRGHLASDATFDYSRESLKTVYSMINVVPMDRYANRIVWLKLEKYERLLAIKYNKVLVINYCDGSIDVFKGITVPRKIYKVIQYGDFVECFYIYNNNKSTIHKCSR